MVPSTGRPGGWIAPVDALWVASLEVEAGRVVGVAGRHHLRTAPCTMPSHPRFTNTGGRVVHQSQNGDSDGGIVCR